MNTEDSKKRPLEVPKMSPAFAKLAKLEGSVLSMTAAKDGEGKTILIPTISRTLAPLSLTGSRVNGGRCEKLHDCLELDGQEAHVDVEAYDKFTWRNKSLVSSVVEASYHRNIQAWLQVSADHKNQLVQHIKALDCHDFIRLLYKVLRAEKIKQVGSSRLIKPIGQFIKIEGKLILEHLQAAVLEGDPKEEALLFINSLEKNGLLLPEAASHCKEAINDMPIADKQAEVSPPSTKLTEESPTTPVVQKGFFNKPGAGSSSPEDAYSTSESSPEAPLPPPT